jgi:DNA-binding CsgD family transcriptional regulator
MVTPNEDLITAARSLVEPGSVAEAWIESQSDPIDLKHLDRIRRVAREAGDQALEMQVLAHRILHCHGAGLWDESRIYERELLDLSVSARNDDALFEGMYWSIARDVSSGEIGRTQRRRFAALDRTSQGRKVAGAVDALPLVDAVLGAWDIAEAKATRILDTLQTSCDSDPVGLSCMTLAQIHLERGHTTLFQESLSRLRSLSDRPDARVAVLLAAEAKALGKRESAREAMSIVNAINRAASQAYWVNQFCTFVVADVAVAKANQRAAQSLLASGSFDLVKFRVPATQFWNPFHQEASLLDLCGETELACVRFEDAIAFCRSADYHPELARTCFDYAAVLARDRLRPGRRAALLALGERSACKCGMVPLVERFRDLGATGAVTPEAHSPSGLTDREIEVGYYVSHGHTNREIGEELNISVHTVNRHIQNMLGKTGMSNRTELAAYLISKGLV